MSDSDAPQQYWADQIMSTTLGPPEFYLEPYIPREGIVLIHARSGSYKTAIALNMAKAVSSGTTIWGCRTSHADPVLFIEADCGEHACRHRAEVLDVGDCRLAFAFPKRFDVLKRDAWYKFLAEIHRQHQFKVVFIDSLRRIHTEEDIRSDVPPRVYDALEGLFPGAALVLVHHDSKGPTMGVRTQQSSAESFAGSQAWMNHAAVVVKVSRPQIRGNRVILDHTKSQVGAQAEPLVLLAQADNVHLERAADQSVHRRKLSATSAEPGHGKSVSRARVAEVYAQVVGEGRLTSVGEIILEVAKRVPCSPSTVERWRAATRPTTH